MGVNNYLNRNLCSEDKHVILSFLQWLIGTIIVIRKTFYALGHNSCLSKLFCVKLDNGWLVDSVNEYLEDSIC